MRKTRPADLQVVVRFRAGIPDLVARASASRGFLLDILGFRVFLGFRV